MATVVPGEQNTTTQPTPLQASTQPVGPPAPQNSPSHAPAASKAIQGGSGSAASRNGGARRSRGRGRARDSSGRGRGATRGRSRGRGRGGGTTGARHEDPSEGWTLNRTACETVVLESAFAEKVIQNRARMFCSNAVTQLKLQCEARSLPCTRCGFTVLLLQGLIDQLRNWANEYIRLRNKDQECVSIAEMYRYVSELLLSHTTGFSFEKNIEVLRQAGSTAPSLDRVRFIADNILEYAPTGRGRQGEMHWNAQRDQKRQLSEFESIGFRDTRKVFFCPLHLLATLDDDLYGTRASDNQVKMLSARKADKEGHSADALADALFRIILAIRFRRRGEAQTESVKKLLSTVLDGRGEEANTGCIVTADRGYGKQSFLEILSGFGLSSVFVMPEHLLRVHSFVGLSYLDPVRDDLEDEALDIGDAEGESEPGAADMGDTHGEGNGEHPAVAPHQLYCDRRRTFVIDNDPNLGPEAFFATKNAGTGRGRSRQRSMNAIAVRERGTDKFSKVLRFMYTVPAGIQDALNTWIAVPKQNIDKKFTLFQTLRRGNEMQDLQDVVSVFLRERCEVLTVSQRCADWFVLRQFRVTGTNAGLVLMSSPCFRSILRLPASSGTEETTMPQWFERFYKGWFSTKTSTEAMMRGSANECAVLSALRAKPFVTAVFEVGMLAVKERRFLSCSPDGIAVLDTSIYDSEGVGEVTMQDGEGNHIILGCVEIKTRVADSSVGEAVLLSCPDVVLCEAGNDTFHKYIPQGHMAQLMQQVFVLGLRVGIYVAAAETGILYIVVYRCSEMVLRMCEDVLMDIASPIVKWAHEDTLTIPSFVTQNASKPY
ncbi:hypothetical protein BWQ96_06981 [Gracilariopsis chorda]|uniref:YqaJ viral recombinase domain-containing protein n=1 Tax=Gracilariopsis chorda TaxID=448386 RepID=A0A2V3IMH3_9FLOR|nr:hypothetical protein BWQ96_06981 [Gracilariopsis chorda]|eukprot:PXF43284.1 hypothetical protein BWQ96_06981 [Gracilariopsis chorda]